jgi:hypothetical protein
MTRSSALSAQAATNIAASLELVLEENIFSTQANHGFHFEHLLAW